MTAVFNSCLVVHAAPVALVYSIHTMAAAASFGLYLGNTSACLAIYKDENVDVVANNAGDRVTAAVVAFNDSEKIIGLAAKAGLFRNGAVSVIHNKRLMNKNIDPTELELAIKNSPCKLINENKRLYYLIKKGEKNDKITPAAISTMIFEAMYNISTTAAHDDDEHNVVLCVPLRFTAESTKAWSQSAVAAGFKVLQTIGEPTATCLAHSIGKDKKKTDLVLVYRIGGVTSEVTIIRAVGGAYTVLSTQYYPELGGKKLTQLLTTYLGNEFSNKFKLDPTESRRSISKLTTEAEKCKHILSTMSSAHCFVESLYDGVDFSYNISRARFENLIGSCMSEYIKPIDDILKSTSHTAQDIDKIILCGGTMKIPKLQEKIGSLFPNGQVLNNKWSPDETMAIGAAMHSSLLLSHGMHDRDLNSRTVELHCLDKELSLQFEDLEPIVIPEGSIVPIRIQTILDVPKTSDDKVKLQIFEREAKDCVASKKIGSISLNFNGGKLKVDTDFTEASLNVHITDIATSKKSSFRFGIHEDDS